ALARDKHSRSRRGRQTVRPVRHAPIAVSEPDRTGTVARHTEPENDPGILLLDSIKRDTTQARQLPRLLQQILIPQIRGDTSAAPLRRRDREPRITLTRRMNTRPRIRVHHIPDNR